MYLSHFYLSVAPHLRYIIYGPDTRRVMLYLANIKTSDEMIIPTLLQVRIVVENTSI